MVLHTLKIFTIEQELVFNKFIEKLRKELNYSISEYDVEKVIDEKGQLYIFGYVPSDVCDNSEEALKKVSKKIKIKDCKFLLKYPTNKIANITNNVIKVVAKYQKEISNIDLVKSKKQIYFYGYTSFYADGDMIDDIMSIKNVVSAWYEPVGNNNKNILVVEYS